MMKFLRDLKNNQPIKVTLIFLCFLLLLNLLFILCNTFTEYLYIIELIRWRLIIVLCILVLSQGLLNLPLAKDFQQEILIFNEGSANKSCFIAYLRKYHFTLILFVYLFYFLAVTYFVEEPLTSYLLGFLSFVSLILYLVQFVVYTNAYVKKSFKSNKSIFSDKKGQTRTMATATDLKKIAVVCYECAKGIIVLGGGAEVGYKLTHGGMNDVSPWRQQWLNQTFPEDRTKIWTETKSAMAMHNRAMGHPHNNIYESLGDKIIKELPKKKP